MTRADTGIFEIGFNARLARFRAVPPKGFFEDVVMDGLAQVLAHWKFGGDQLVQGLQRVRNHIGV